MSGLLVGRPPPGPVPEGPAAPRSPFDFPQGERPPCPRMALSLWVSAFAGMTRVGVCGKDEGCEGAPSTGSGRTDLESGPATGSWGCDGGGDAPRRAPLDTGFRRYDDGGVRAGKCWWCWGGGPLRVPSGQASTGSGRTDLGSGPATGSRGCDGGGDAPRRAPLDTGFRRYDGGGVRGLSCGGGRAYHWHRQSRMLGRRR